MRWYREDHFDSEGLRDQNADTGLVPQGYWSLCLADDGRHWRMTLLEQNEGLDEVIAEPFTGDFLSETEAKQFAEESEVRGYIPGHPNVVRP